MNKDNGKLNKSSRKKISCKDLFKGLSPDGKYAHLKIILHRESITSSRLGMKYLMVTPDAFGVVKLIDIEYSDNNIHLLLKDELNGFIDRISLNPDNKSFQFILILWDDIIQITNDEKKRKSTLNDLLEFEF